MTFSPLNRSLFLQVFILWFSWFISLEISCSLLIIFSLFSFIFELVSEFPRICLLVSVFWFSWLITFCHLFVNYLFQQVLESQEYLLMDFFGTYMSAHRSSVGCSFPLLPSFNRFFIHLMFSLFCPVGLHSFYSLVFLVY